MGRKSAANFRERQLGISSVRSVSGAQRCSDVKVTKADGSVEVRPAYKHAEALKVVRDGDSRPSARNDEQLYL
jgi:hypothetical protein